MSALSVGGALLPAAASNFELWRAHAARDGYNLTITSAADAFRTYEIQERIFRERYTTTYLPGRPTKRWNGVTYWLKPGKATAAVPGTSNHGKGLAVDIRNAGSFSGPFYKWMAETGPSYGWSNTEGRSIGEPWHWVNDNKPRGAVGSIADAIPEKKSPVTEKLKEFDMPVRIRHSDGTIYYVDIAKGTFIALEPTVNGVLSNLKVDIVWDEMTTAEVNLVRQAVVDLSRADVKN